MRHMEKVLAFSLCLLLLAGLLTGCAGGEGPADDGRLSIVVTIFPEYDWVREILGDQAQNVSLTLLLNSGADLHNYQPTPKDIAVIANCDLFLYTGGVSDKWVTDVLAQSGNPDLAAIDLMAALGDLAKEEEIVEGMEDDDEAGGDPRDAEHIHGEVEYDEHVWLSLKNADVLCSIICDKLCALDPAHAEIYRDNTASYQEQLGILDAEYRAAVDDAEFTTLLFADRFPFRYLTDDYGLRYYAAFAGCSAETEASFETIAFLSAKTDELGLRSILQIESSNGSVARTVRDNTQTKDQQILTMDSMQSITPADVEAGKTYISIMKENLEVLKQALH